MSITSIDRKLDVYSKIDKKALAKAKDIKDLREEHEKAANKLLKAQEKEKESRAVEFVENTDITPIKQGKELFDFFGELFSPKEKIKFFKKNKISQDDIENLKKGIEERKNTILIIEEKYKTYGLSYPLESEYLRNLKLEEKKDFINAIKSLESTLNTKDASLFSNKRKKQIIKSQLESPNTTQTNAINEEIKQQIKLEKSSLNILDETIDINGIKIRKMSVSSKKEYLNYYKNCNLKERAMLVKNWHNLVKHEANLSKKYAKLITELNPIEFKIKIREFEKQDYFEKNKTIEKTKNPEKKENNDLTNLKSLKKEKLKEIKELQQLKLISKEKADLLKKGLKKAKTIKEIENIFRSLKLEDQEKKKEKEKKHLNSFKSLKQDIENKELFTKKELQQFKKDFLETKDQEEFLNKLNTEIEKKTKKLIRKAITESQRLCIKESYSDAISLLKSYQKNFKHNQLIEIQIKSIELQEKLAEEENKKTEEEKEKQLQETLINKIFNEKIEKNTKSTKYKEELEKEKTLRRLLIEKKKTKSKKTPKTAQEESLYHLENEKDKKLAKYFYQLHKDKIINENGKIENIQKIESSNNNSNINNKETKKALEEKKNSKNKIENIEIRDSENKLLNIDAALKQQENRLNNLSRNIEAQSLNDIQKSQETNIIDLKTYFREDHLDLHEKIAA